MDRNTTSMTTALYITNEGAATPLRYSLRSVAEFLPHDNVVISGFMPDYVKGVHHVPGKDETGLRDINIQRKFLAGLKSEHTHDEVVLMCDDVYLMQPFTEKRTRYKGLLKDRIASLETRPENDQFRLLMEATLRCCEAMGIDEPLDFGCHHPIFMDREKAIEVVEFSLGREVPICVTTLYQYMNATQVIKGQQAKGEVWRGSAKGPVYSTSAHIEKNYGFKEYMHLNLTDTSYEK